jgi:integrase
MEKLGDDLKQSRNSLSDGSIKTYKSILGTLYKKMNDVSKIEEKNNLQEFFCKNPKDTLKFLNDLTVSKRKTTLSALVVLCFNNEKAKDIYREQLIEDSDKYREDQKENGNEMTDKQKENWVDWKDVINIHNQLGKEVNPLFSKPSLTSADFMKLQDYIILSLYVLQDPRRSLDYVSMRIKNIDKKNNEENYIDGKNFVFNNYKTKSLYGQQKIPISTKLKTLLNKWIKINPTEFLLVSPTSAKPLNIVQLNQRLNKIFGKKVGSNMLRHSYLTSLYDVQKMKTIANNMGHSTQEAIGTYAKKKPE